MKTSDLKLINVQELSVLEMKNYNGGAAWLLPFLVGVVSSGLVGEIIREGVKKCVDDFKKGFSSVEDNK